MRREQEIKERLNFLEKIAEDQQPDCPYEKVPIPKIKNAELRGEIVALLWALDLIG